MLEEPLFRVAYQTSSRQVQSKAGFVSRLRNSWLCIHKKKSEENKSKTLIWNLIRAGKQSYLFTKRLKDKKCSQCTLLHCTMPFWSAGDIIKLSKLSETFEWNFRISETIIPLHCLVNSNLEHLENYSSAMTSDLFRNAVEWKLSVL